MAQPPSRPEARGRLGSHRLAVEATCTVQSNRALPIFGYLTNQVCSAYPLVAIRTGFTGIVEDVMRLELHYRSDIDLSQPAMQVQIRSHIARYLRDFPQSGEGVITLGGVEHCFMYIVQDDVVETVIGPPDYVEQVLNERGLSTHEASSPLPDPDHKH